MTERELFYFETIFIPSFERGRYYELQYYKCKESSIGILYTDDFKEKAKFFENYLRGDLFLRTATPRIQNI